MKSVSFAAGLVVLAAALPGLAHAGVYDFTLSGTDLSASGVLITAGALSATGTLITGVSGEQNGSAITGLRAPGTYPAGALSNDNLLFSGTPSLDQFGFSFAASGASYNVYFEGGAGTGYYEFSRPGSTELASFSLSSPTSVPEPASRAVLALGLLTLSMFYVRRPS